MIRVTRVIRMTRVVKIRSRGILWIAIQFLYIYTVMTGSEDQQLDLSYGQIFIHTYIFLVYLHVFCNVSVVYFMECVSNANLRYNSHMYQLMNFDFLECD